MKIQTINQLISVWKDIATRHYQLNHFGIGDSWEIGVKANMHPVLWINPVTASMPSSDNGYKTFEIDFEVRVFDLVDKDELNENDVLSDTIDILKDIIAEFKGHPYYVNSQLNIIDDISFEAFTEEFDEEVSGWLCEISLMTPVLTTFCGIPSADITGFEFPGIDCPDVNVLCPVYVEDVTGVYPIEVTTIGTTKEVSLAVPVGEINTSSNSGTGEGVALAKVGDDLPMKSFKAGTNVTLSSTSTEITINASGGGSGEVNTSSNSGGGEGLAQTKVGSDLPFKSITAGSNITLNATADELEISATDTGEDNTSSNSGTGEGLALTKVGVDLPFKTIKAGANITLNSTATELEIVASSGGGNTIYTANDTVGAGRIVTLTDSLTITGGQTTLEGTGTTDATSALLVKNGTPSTLLDIKDDGKILAGVNSNINVGGGVSNTAYLTLNNTGGAVMNWRDVGVGGHSKIACVTSAVKVTGDFKVTDVAGHIPLDIDSGLGAALLINSTDRATLHYGTPHKLQITSSETILTRSGTTLIKLTTGKSEIGGVIKASGTPSYVDDAGAGVGGLVTGEIFLNTTLGALTLKS